jgi:hypothetical protein
LNIKANLREDIYRQAHAQAAALRQLPPSFRNKVPNKALIVRPGTIRPLELIQELTAMRVPVDRTAARKSRS